MCGVLISSPRSIMLTALGNIAWRLGREIRNLEHLSPCIAYAQNRCSLFGVMCGSIFILTEKTSTFPNSDFCCCFFSLEAVAMFINSPPHPPQIAQCEFLWIANVWEKAKGNIHSRGSFASSGVHDLRKECISEIAEARLFSLSRRPTLRSAFSYMLILWASYRLGEREEGLS